MQIKTIKGFVEQIKAYETQMLKTRLSFNKFLTNEPDFQKAVELVNKFNEENNVRLKLYFDDCYNIRVGRVIEEEGCCNTLLYFGFYNDLPNLITLPNSDMFGVDKASADKLFEELYPLLAKFLQ